MTRADGEHVDEPRRPRDVDETEELMPRPPGEPNIAPPPRTPGVRRPADRWSTVFTVFAAIALVALLLLGAAVISSQPLAVPSASPSPSALPSASRSTSFTPAPRTAAPSEAPHAQPRGDHVPDSGPDPDHGCADPAAAVTAGHAHAASDTDSVKRRAGGPHEPPAVVRALGLVSGFSRSAGYRRWARRPSSRPRVAARCGPAARSAT